MDALPACDMLYDHPAHPNSKASWFMVVLRAPAFGLAAIDISILVSVEDC